MSDNIKKLYKKTHKIRRRKFKMYGSEVVLDELKGNQSVCYGDGRSYYYLLTRRKNK